MKSNFELELYHQAQVIDNFVQNKYSEVAQLGTMLRANSPRFVLIAARGTSENAAVYAKYLFGVVNRAPVGLAMLSLTTLSRKAPDLTDSLVVGLSQSGQSPDILTFLRTLEGKKHSLWRS